MDKDIKILIVPDIHGRQFYKEPVDYVLNNTDSTIVFLGDYLDPYPDEFKKNEFNNVKRNAISQLEELFELKSKYKDRIILLLGNHDVGYIYSDVCSCRRDRENYFEIRELFNKNHENVQLAYESTINNNHFIFSHAGISEKYAKLCFSDLVNERNVVDLFNNAWLTKDWDVLQSLELYDFYRGYGGGQYASLVWADAREWVDTEFRDANSGYGKMVFGHTQFSRPINYKDKFYMVDFHECTYIDSNGDVRVYNTDEIINKK